MIINRTCLLLFVFLELQPFGMYFPQPGDGLLASSISMFLDHTQRRATVCRTPLDECINRIYETQIHLSLYLVSFLVGLRTYQQPRNIYGQAFG
jgi:hypothetical protein